MKVLALKPSFYFPSNGGEIELLEKFQELKKRGHEVLVEGFCTPQDQIQLEILLNQAGWEALKNSQYELLGVKVKLHVDSLFLQHDVASQPFFESHLREVITAHSPDEVWVHYTDYFAVAAALHWNPKKTWVRFTDNEYPRPAKLKDFPSLTAAYEAISNVQVTSKFMMDVVAKDFPQAELRRIPNWLPVLDEKPERIPQAGEYFLFVNPAVVKGFEFILQLAAELPEEKFLVIGNWAGETPKGLPANIQFQGRQPSLKKFYENAKVLLMPSVWEEAFGRLPLEAMAQGVPVIASDRGNLPETLGGGGQALPLELSRWKEALAKMPLERKDWQERGFQRIRVYREEADQIFTNRFGGRV